MESIADKVIKLKSLGNEYYKNGDYQSAIASFTEAIAYDEPTSHNRDIEGSDQGGPPSHQTHRNEIPGMDTVYCNRSMCYANIGMCHVCPVRIW